MSSIQLPIPATAGPGSATPSSGVNLILDGPRTFCYANGDPLDVTDIETTVDGVSWIKIGTRQVGGAWAAPVTVRASFVRLNRITVGPFGAGAAAFVAANDFLAPSQVGATGGVAGLGNAGALNNLSLQATAPPTTVLTLPFFSVSAAPSAVYQFELNVVYHLTSGSGISGSRKVCLTLRAQGGTLTIEGQSTPFTNDNAGLAVTVTFAVAGSTLNISLPGSASSSIAYGISGVLNTVA